MEPKEVIAIFRRTITEHYVDFHGRVSRREFWYFLLATIVAVLAAGLIDTVMGTGLLRPLVSLALLLPTAGLGARRLQDTGRSAGLVWVWLGLTAALQLIAIAMVFWWFVAGTPDNYGGIVALTASAAMIASLVTVISLASVVVGLILIYFWWQPGTPGPNPFGPEPADTVPSAVTTP